MRATLGAMRNTLAAAVVVAVGLSAGGAVAQGPLDHEPDPEIADGSAKRALDAAKRRWRRAGVTRYRFTIRTSCFCPPSTTGPRTYEVRGGKVIRPRGDTRDLLATVPRLHRLVQESIDDDVAQLDVKYDARGVPRRVALDGRRAIADDEISHAVTRFQRVRPPR